MVAGTFARPCPALTLSGPLLALLLPCPGPCLGPALAMIWPWSGPAMAML